MAAKTGNQKIYGVYNKSVLTTKLILHITEVGKNARQILEQKLRTKVEGRCIEEGFIRPGSSAILNYSSGAVNSENIEFHVSFECMLCYPVEGMLIECVCKTVTKAGIHAQVVDDDGNMPVTVFIARDHHYLDDRINTIKENAKMLIKVVGIRFELNDPYICAIGSLAEYRKEDDDRKKKPKIVLGGDVADEDDV
jgi:DNA-directed RNA polymerase subunit E'/Rpb7